MWAAGSKALVVVCVCPVWGSVSAGARLPTWLCLLGSTSHQGWLCCCRSQGHHAPLQSPEL